MSKKKEEYTVEQLKFCTGCKHYDCDPFEWPCSMCGPFDLSKWEEEEGEG